MFKHSNAPQRTRLTAKYWIFPFLQNSVSVEMINVCNNYIGQAFVTFLDQNSVKMAFEVCFCAPAGASLTGSCHLNISFIYLEPERTTVRKSEGRRASWGLVVS